MQNSIATDLSALPNFLQLNTTAGVLAAELTLPTYLHAWILLPHPINFLSDARYTKRVAKLNQEGFATFCCNIQTLQDLHTPFFCHDTAALTERLLAMIDAALPLLQQNPAPIILCTEAQLTAAAVRVSVIRDATIRGVITHGGRPEDAGKTFLPLTTENWLALPESTTQGFLPTNAVDWILSLVRKTPNSTNI